MPRKSKYAESSSDSESEEEENIDIHEIVRTGTYQEVKEAIAKDRPRLVCLKDKFGRLAIHYAAALNRMDILVHLIVKKSNVDAKDNRDQTPLHLAAAKGLSDMCRLLLENKANIRLKDNECWTALHHAVDGRFFETATVLIKRKADINAEDHRFGRTVLHIAAEKGYPEFVEMLIIRGADLCASGDRIYSKTPLHLACLHGHTECVRILVERNADVAAMSGFLDKTPLHMACEAGYLHCASIIVDTKTDLDITGNRINGSTPLHLAVEHNHLDVARMLIEKGANREQWGKFTVVGPPLHMACKHGKIDAVRLLLELGCELDHRDPNAEIPLHIACKYSHYDIAIMLIRLGSDFRLKGVNGKTPFDYVDLPVIKEKIRIIADEMDVIREAREYAEREAAKVEAARLRKEEKLLQETAAAEERERLYQMQRRMDFIAQLRAVADVSGELSALELVIQEFPDQNYNEIICEETQASAFTAAASHRFAAIVHKLLQWPPLEVNHQDRAGNTALHYAAMNDDRDQVEELLLAGVKTGLMNREGKVAVNYAKATYVQEVMRNPSLIVNKARYQSAVEWSISIQTAAIMSRTLTVADSGPDSIVSSPGRLALLDHGSSAVAGVKSLLARKHSAQQASSMSSEKHQHQQQQQYMSHMTPPQGSPMKPQLSHINNKVTEKFGTVPESFGGSRADLFFSDGTMNNSDNSHNAHGSQPSNTSRGTMLMILPAAAAEVSSDHHQPTVPSAPETTATTTHSHPPQPQFIDVFTFQRSYVPSAFDTTAEYCEVKDHLWLLGYPYKSRKTCISRQPDTQNSSLIMGHDGCESPPLQPAPSAAAMAVGDFDQFTAFNTMNNSLVTENNIGIAIDTGGASPIDKKFYLYCIACVMDDIQKLFTNTDKFACFNSQSDVQDAGAIAAQGAAAEALIFPPLAPVRTIGNTAAELFLERRDRLPFMTAKGAVASIVSEAMTNLSTLAGHNVSGHIPYRTNNSSLIEYMYHQDSASTEVDVELTIIDYTQHFVPSNISHTDYTRLIIYAKLCDAYLALLMRLFEPEHYGWPEESPATGEAPHTIWDKIQAVRESGVVTPEVEALLYKLATCSYDYNNSEFGKWHEYYAYLKQEKEEKESKFKIKATFAEVKTSDFDMFSSLRKERGEETEDESERNVPKQPADEAQEEQPQEQQEQLQEQQEQSAEHTWELFTNPPRFMRVVIDTVFEISQFVSIQAEQIYPLDAMRAHLWAQAGREAIEKKLESVIYPQREFTGLQLWLRECRLTEYEPYFVNEGFKILSDFVGLSEQDCRDYFPFLKIGDVRRLSKAVHTLSDDMVQRIERKAVATTMKRK